MFNYIIRLDEQLHNLGDAELCTYGKTLLVETVKQCGSGYLTTSIHEKTEDEQ